MCNTPLLSIIVPVYNVEKYIRNCLDSILAQDFTNYEVILVDDGSTDNSGMICDQYASDNSSFKCIHKPNGGLPSARKCGYKASQGEYVAFVDSDDWIAPDMYSKMCQALSDTQADIVLCDYTAVMPDREELCTTHFLPGFYDKNRLETEVYPFMIYSGTFYKYGIAPNFWNKIFRRELLQSHLFQVPDDVVNGEDVLATYSCILEASSIYIINKSLYYYRSNADSLSRRTMPVTRLSENHKMFQTFLDVINVSSYPYMQKQLDYFFVYQCLLTYAPVFKSMISSPSELKQSFFQECSYPLIQRAFTHVPIRNVTGIHNRLYSFCIRHKLFKLYMFLLKH